MGCNLVKEGDMNAKISEVVRWDLINSATDEAQLATPGKDVNEQYEGVIKLLRANPLLNNSEKIQAEKNFTFIKDRENLIRLKKPTYPCEQCHRLGYTILFCEHCARERLERDFVNWTSGNEIIDRAIQQSQSMLPLPRYLIEWIPYTDLEDVKYKTKGGCAEILTATWKKGVILSFDNEKQEFERSPAGVVVLKKLLNSQDANEKFLEELKVHILLGSKGYTVATCYGVTRDPSTGEYVLVLANYEQDFGSYIKKSYDSVTWKDIYNIFYNISEDLYNMHRENLIHRDLHSKNVLKSAGNLFNLSDFGICGPANMGSSNVYGNLPFIAPEIFLKQPYTTASDIYSMGMLMYHATVGHPPFANCHHDLLLVSEVIAGIRPPDCISSQIPMGDIHEGQSATLVYKKGSSKLDEIQTEHIYEFQGDTLVCENIANSRMWKIEDIPKSPTVEHFHETPK
ncbi:15404_t:CDS:2, partial [Acaulospora colombiana]